jgi:hypothetical protein
VDYLDVEYYSASSEIELRGWVCLWDLEEKGVKRILQAVSLGIARLVCGISLITVGSLGACKELMELVVVREEFGCESTLLKSGIEGNVSTVMRLEEGLNIYLERVIRKYLVA